MKLVWIDKRLYYKMTYLSFFVDATHSTMHIYGGHNLSRLLVNQMNRTSFIKNNKDYNDRLPLVDIVLSGLLL